MFKRSLLAAAVSAIVIPNVYSAPFMPMDARGLAMGNTGVATARMVHAPAYNPSLLSQMNEKDDFGFLFPHIGVVASDEGEVIDTAQDITDYMIDNFEDAMDGKNGNDGLIDRIKALTNNTDGSFKDVRDAINTANETIKNLTASSNFDTAKQEIQAIKDANAALASDFNNLEQSITLTQSSIGELTTALDSISGNPLNARLGTMAGIAIPSKKLAVGVVLQGSVNVSAKLDYDVRDGQQLDPYFDATNELLTEFKDINGEIAGFSTDLNAGNLESFKASLNDLLEKANGLQGFTSDATLANGTPVIEDGAISDPNANELVLQSQVSAVAVGIAELGVTLAREFEIKGQKISFGATPKIQKIMTYSVSKAVDDFDDLEFDDLKDSRQDYTKFNLDLGASYRFGGKDQYIVGLTGKNLLSGNYDYTDEFGNKLGQISLKPQYRAGIGYTGGWFNIGADIDLTENKPVAFEAPTQYAAIGAEFNAFDVIQLRAGYRTNMAKGGVDTVSAGFGISPFGVHIDVAALANPSEWRREAGAAVEIGFNF